MSKLSVGLDPAIYKLRHASERPAAPKALCDYFHVISIVGQSRGIGALNEQNRRRQLNVIRSIKSDRLHLGGQQGKPFNQIRFHRPHLSG